MQETVSPLATHALSSMNKLHSLELLIKFFGDGDLLGRDLQDNELPANCWPLLTDLKLHRSACNQQNTACFRRAAPCATFSNTLKSHHKCAHMHLDGDVMK